MDFLGSPSGGRGDSGNSAGSSGARGGRALRTNALAREGITAATAAIPSARPSSAQAAKTTSRAASVCYQPGQVLPQNEWKSFGDGWIQVTSSDSGQRTKFGLHTVIESNPRRVFLCCYVPFSDGAYHMMTGPSPNYDIEVAAKAMTLHANNPPEFIIILGFVSAVKHVRVRCSTAEKVWSLVVYNDGAEEIIASVLAESIRTNVFYDMLIQVRGDCISLDVDGTPIFTAVKLPYASCLSGFVGVLAVDSKSALKNWKFKEGEAVMRSDIGVSDITSGRAFAPPIVAASAQSRPASTPVRTTPLAAPSDSTAPSGVNEGRAKKAQVKSLSELLGSKSVESTAAPSTVRSSVAAAPPPKASVANIIPQFDDKIADSASLFDSSYSGGGAVTSARDGSASERADGGAEFNNKFAYEGISQGDKMVEVTNQLYSRHEKSIVDSVMRDVIQHDLGVTFDDIAAAENAKRLLNEAVVLPMIMPEFFIGIREPWRGVLLFGPPGTGKTMLAKAAAGVNGSTFFSCSAASLISKYRGESEKIVRCLFETARLLSPSIIFLDEIDALVSARGADGEHEASRRLKTELFSQLDGISSNSSQSVMLLATTNCPWDLDEAMRRRLEKRIYIPLPDFMGRVELFEICLRKIDVDNDSVDLRSLASLTAGYSGADIRIICRDAAMMPMRRLLAEKAPDEIARMRSRGQLVMSKVIMQDFVDSIKNTNPSVSSQYTRRYEEWDQEFGSR